jgi:hypothetical protein
MQKFTLWTACNGEMKPARMMSIEHVKGAERPAVATLWEYEHSGRMASIAASTAHSSPGEAARLLIELAGENDPVRALITNWGTREPLPGERWHGPHIVYVPRLVTLVEAAQYHYEVGRHE